VVWTVDAGAAARTMVVRRGGGLGRSFVALFHGFFLLIFFSVTPLPKGRLYIFYLLLIEKPAIAGSFKKKIIKIN